MRHNTEKLDVAKLNIFSDDEGGDVDLSLSVVAWKDGHPVLRVELTAASAWYGFDLNLEEANTFAEQIRLGALALRGAIAEKKTPPPARNDGSNPGPPPNQGTGG